MANKLPTTNLGRLARQLRKTPMTKKQIVTFLLAQNGEEYVPVLPSDTLGNSDRYNSTLYGTRSRAGFLETTKARKKGQKWFIPPTGNTVGPFTPAR